jgi:hypothetical protein
VCESKQRLRRQRHPPRSAARVACKASCTRAFFSFISVSVGGADTYYGNITGELGQTLLQFFATVIRGGFLVVRNGHLPEREMSSLPSMIFRPNIGRIYGDFIESTFATVRLRTRSN